MRKKIFYGNRFKIYQNFMCNCELKFFKRKEKKKGKIINNSILKI